MNIKTAILTLAAAFVVMGGFAEQSQAQSSMPLWVYYVERDGLHTSGATWTSTLGPYASYEDALAVKNQLDANRNQGNSFFSEARIYSAINPNFIQPMYLVANRLTPWLPLLR